MAPELSADARQAVADDRILALQHDNERLWVIVSELQRDRDKGRGIWMVLTGFGAILVGVASVWDHIVSALRGH